MTTPVIAFVPPAAELELQTISELPAEPTLFYKREEFKTADDHCVPTPPLPESHNRATPAESELPRRDTEEQDEQADPTSPLSPSASQAAQQSWSTEKRVHLPFPYGPRLARLEAAKWRRLFPLYKHIEIPCLPFIRPISIISLIVALVYVVVNLAIFIPLLVQMINGTGTTTNCTGKGGRNGGTDNYATNCIAQGTYNAAATLGTIGSVNFLLLMLPMNRFSVLTALLGISVDRGIMWHKWIARYTIFVLAAHGAGQLVAYWYQGNMSSEALDGAASLNGSGEISILAGFAILLTSWKWIRRYLYEGFFRLHWVLFVVFVIFGMIHEGTFIALAVISLIPFALDYYLRYRVWRRPVNVLAARALAADVVRIDFDQQDFHYSAGQWIMVCIPEVSPLEWHPFSLSSSPHHSSMVIHCRVLGNWTKRLQRVVLNRPVDASRLSMYIEGPYGTLELPLSDYKSVLLVSGGIGITPLQSVFNSISHDMRLGLRSMNRLRFAWSVREIDLVHSIHGAQLHSLNPNQPAPRLPAAFQPDMLSVHHPPPNQTPRAAQADGVQSVVQTSFHLTTGGEKMEPEHLQALRRQYGHMFQVGRMDVYKLLGEMRDAAKMCGDTRVAVLLCGPESLVRGAMRACCEMSDKEVMFDLHSENFEW